MDETAAAVHYRAAPHKLLNLGFDRFLAYLPGAEKRFILSGLESQVLQQCRVPATLPSHLTRLRSSGRLTNQNSDGASIRTILLALQERGLLIEQRRLLPLAMPPKERARITSVAFVTANRPTALIRSYQSYLTNFQTYNREPAVLVMDDSKSMAARSEYLQGLRQAGSCATVRYSGATEKQAFIEQLAQQGIDPVVASFALTGASALPLCTTGANRNCVLLDTLGELVLTADDDTICALVQHPERDEILRLGNHENPREVWFWGSRAEVASRLDAGRDLLGEHENLLGRSVGQVAAGMPDTAVDGQRSCMHLLAALSDDDAEIVVTIPGMAGDSGAGCAQRFLLC